MIQVYDFAAVEIGQHFYWNFLGFPIHGQVLINTWIVFAIIIIVSLLTTSELVEFPESTDESSKTKNSFYNSVYLPLEMWKDSLGSLKSKVFTPDSSEYSTVEKEDEAQRALLSRNPAYNTYSTLPAKEFQILKAASQSCAQVRLESMKDAYYAESYAGPEPVQSEDGTEPETTPTDKNDKFLLGGQNFMEYAVEFVRDIASNQIGKEASKWTAFIGTLFMFIFVSNWSGALVPWKLFELPNGELGAPTNDINTTVCLALLTSIAYFYAGLRKKGFTYFIKYVEPTPILLPINVLEDFTKPLSLSFRLFGNILADELVVAVLVSLVPLVVPIPLIFLGLFTSGIQALIFATLAGAYIGEALEGH